MTSLDHPVRMPVVFFGHGSPTTILTKNKATASWRDIAARIPKPKAILCISAHWYTNRLYVTAMERPRTIHDFGPLSPDLFKITYPAPGAPELAQRIRELAAPVEVGLDQQWGLDHGSWTVLSVAYPEADIPVVQLSLDSRQSPGWHLEFAKKLRPLRDEGVLIVGSGNIVHNLSVLEWKDNVPPYDWAVRFRDFILENVQTRSFDTITAYADQGSDAALSVPHPDHFLPVLYVLGASVENDSVDVETDYFQFKSLSMASLVFSDTSLAA
ncbi:MAG: 4,5-DOPA dioxygenase extradiol [Pseudomonadota bacterium]